MKQNCEIIRDLMPLYLDGTTIGSKAFANCRNLIYVRIPSSVTTIASDAFSGCPNVIIDRVGN